MQHTPYLLHNNEANHQNHQSPSPAMQHATVNTHTFFTFISPGQMFHPTTSHSYSYYII